LILDFAKEEVWKEGKLIHKESRDKLRLMVERFLSGDFD
jgi:UDP-N-acetylglucosamine 3-dehydrogenase